VLSGVVHHCIGSRGEAQGKEKTCDKRINNNNNNDKWYEVMEAKLLRSVIL
jgi:hypothetical protein